MEGEIKVLGITKITLPTPTPPLCPSLLSFLRSLCRTQAPPWIIKSSKPHLTSNNEAASLPCSGRCEAQQTFADGALCQQVGSGCLGPSSGVCPGSSPLFHSQPCLG